jgi:hypothetical protein
MNRIRFYALTSIRDLELLGPDERDFCTQALLDPSTQQGRVTSTAICGDLPKLLRHSRIQPDGYLRTKRPATSLDWSWHLFPLFVVIGFLLELGSESRFFFSGNPAHLSIPPSCLPHSYFLAERSRA